MAQNACSILDMCGEHDIPVIKGGGPIASEYDGHSGIFVHGENGVGGVQLPETAKKPILDMEASGLYR